VQGLDATAARTIGTLYGTLHGRGVQLLIACLHSAEIVRLLRCAIPALLQTLTPRVTPPADPAAGVRNPERVRP